MPKKMTRLTRSRSRGGQTNTTASKHMTLSQNVHVMSFRKKEDSICEEENDRRDKYGERDEVRLRKDQDPEQEQATVRETKDLHAVISNLCKRTSLLESTVAKQNDLLLKFTCTEKSIETRATAVNAQTQTAFMNDSENFGSRSYAEAIKFNPSNTDKKTSVEERSEQTVKDISNKIQRKINNAVEKKKNDANIKHDVKSHPDKVRHALEHEENKHNLPKIVMLHDSIMKGINGNRLGRSYGFSADLHKTFSIKDIPAALLVALSSTKESVDMIIVHCGVNDVKKSDPKVCSKAFVQCIQDISSKQPKTKIVISKIATVQDPDTEVSRQLFNALITNDLFKIENVSFIGHDNLQITTLKDGLHPNTRGTSVLPGNLGRHVRHLFWSRPRKTARRPLTPPPMQRYLPPSRQPFFAESRQGR